MISVNNIYALSCFITQLKHIKASFYVIKLQRVKNLFKIQLYLWVVRAHNERFKPSNSQMLLLFYS